MAAISYKKIYGDKVSIIPLLLLIPSKIITALFFIFFIEISNFPTLLVLKRSEDKRNILFSPNRN